MPDPKDYAAEEAEFDALDGEDFTLTGKGERDSGDTSLDIGSNTRDGDRESERLSADIANKIPGWRGVRSCSDRDRAITAAQPHAQAWVNATIAAHPDREVLGSAFYGRHNWDNWTTSSGRRKCRGWWSSCIVYVDFAK